MQRYFYVMILRNYYIIPIFGKSERVVNIRNTEKMKIQVTSIEYKRDLIQETVQDDFEQKVSFAITQPTKEI